MNQFVCNCGLKIRKLVVNNMISLEVSAKKYPPLGQCIFCGRTPPEVKLTEEHIIPYGISGVGELSIISGSCMECNADANRRFEGPALASDFKIARILLELKRRRRGKKGLPLSLPMVSAGNQTMQSDAEFDIMLSRDEYPNLIFFIYFEPPGMLVGIDRGSDLKNFRISNFYLGRKSKEVSDVTMREPHNHTAFSLTIAKIAYCYAVARLGLDAFDRGPLLDLISGRRDDVYNFVGGISINESLSDRHLHSLYIRERGKYLSVIVHLFASCKMEPYEVVVGELK